MHNFNVEFQINERGTVPIFAKNREDAEKKVRELLDTGGYLKYIQRSDSWVEAL